MISIKNFSLKSVFISFSLFIVLLIGFLVRVWDLEKNPAGFFCDEASIGYNAYSILKTGKDQYGIPYPVLFKTFGQYKDPVPIYSTIPFIALFGLNEFSIRLTAVIYGTLTILVLYFFVEKLFNKKVALLSSFFLAISPWHIHFSRVGFELIFSVFWITLSLYLLTKSLNNFEYYYFALSAFFISFFSYYTSKLYLPFVYLSAMITINNRLYLWLTNKKFWLVNIFSLIILVSLIFPELNSGAFFARWNAVKMENMKISNLAKAYLNHFSYRFLFKTGDIDFPGQPITRHSVRGMGELYLFQLPFILIGIGSLFMNKKKYHTILFFILFMLLYPLGSILTSINPQATRSIIGVIPFQVLTALGVVTFFKLIRKTRVFIVSLFFLGIIILASFTHYLYLFKQYPLYASNFWGWQYGPKEIVKYFLIKKNYYDELFMSYEFNGGNIFLKFYDPDNLCQNKCKMGDLILTPEIYNSSKRQLFSLSPKWLKKLKFKDKFRIKKTIYYPNGKEAFYIGEIYKQTFL